MLPRATTLRSALTHLHSNTDEQLARIVRNLVVTLDLGASCESMASPGKQQVASSETQDSHTRLQRGATAARRDGYEAATATRRHWR